MNKQILKGVIFCGLFLIPFLPLPVFSFFFFPFITSKAFAFRIVVEIIFGGWLLLAYLEPNYRPKRSIILWCLAAFLVVIGLADAFGVAPIKSFWSNFERMEGYISLLHFGALFLIISTFFKEREWRAWWNVSLGVSMIVVIYSFLQLAGVAAIHQSSARVDATFGNASYLAVYLLIHIFIAVFYLVRSRGGWAKWLYGVAIAGNLIILYYTATRGAILGLIGGFMIVALLNLTNRENVRVRKVSLFGLIGLVVLVLGFVAMRNVSFIKNNAVLGRFASISTAELKTEGRSFIWPMALQGIKERPLLGWGQDNFNYVFNEHYSPQMYNLEPWFDRAHNIFLDWGVAGGVLGLLCYLSLYVALLLCIWRRPNTLTRLEKTIFTGLLAGYFFHNLFVFDNLISYILFIAILGYVHFQTAQSSQEPVPVSEKSVIYLGLPVVVALGFVLYFVNIKPIMANVDLIHALEIVQGTATPGAATTQFEKAYGDSRLGRPEIVEWISSSAGTILNSSISDADKSKYFDFAKSAVLGQAADLPTDARYQLIAGSFLTQAGQIKEGIAYLDNALKLMPGKQAIYFEKGSALLANKDYSGALAIFKQAYDLAPKYEEAELIYLIGAIYAGNKTVAADLVKQIPPSDLVNDNRVTSALYATGQLNDLIVILENRLNADPTNAQAYADLAMAFAKAGQKTNALTVLQDLIDKIPQYKDQAEAFKQQIQSGNF